MATIPELIDAYLHRSGLTPSVFARQSGVMPTSRLEAIRRGAKPIPKEFAQLASILTGPNGEKWSYNELQEMADNPQWKDFLAVLEEAIALEGREGFLEKTSLLESQLDDILIYRKKPNLTKIGLISLATPVRYTVEDLLDIADKTEWYFY